LNKLKGLTNGLVKENPVLVLMLGTCPALAISTQTSNALGMGLAATAVLVCSNVAISLLRNVIPDKVRIPCFIVLIAGFVTVVQMVLEAYSYSLFQALGIYLPLIVVNCIILGRAEVFASKNKVLDSALDGIGMGIGFTLTILAMATIREAFGNGSLFGIELPVLAKNNVSVLTMAPGGFVVYGCLIALVNKITKGRAIRKDEFGCSACPSASTCGKDICRGVQN